MFTRRIIRGRGLQSKSRPAMSLRKLATLASLISLVSLSPHATATAQDIALPMPEAGVQTQPTLRTWVDNTGKFSIEASLVDWDTDEVRLVRPNGKRVAIDYAQLSELDRNYLASTSLVAQNDLSFAINTESTTKESTTAPEPPQAEALKLPNATSIAPDGEMLQLTEPMRRDITWPSLRRLLVDPPPSTVSIPTCVVSIDSFDGWAACSRPLLVNTEATPQIAISITRGLAFPTGGSHNQITFIDPATSETKTVWEGNKRITLLDHHAPSGLTLILNDHNSVGEGGLLELLKLDVESLSAKIEEPDNTLRSFVRRALPDNGKPRNPSKVTWARMLDSEHIVAVIDASLGCWNLVSGECLYRIDKIDPRVEPVLSPGRRYLALPGSGEILIYSTNKGYPQGRVELDRNLTPNLAFSPYGERLAIVSGKRLRILDLAQGQVIEEVANIRTLGTSSPVWINDDLVISSNGIVLSRSRKTAVWQYDIVGDTITRVGDRVALLRKYRGAELAILDLPHPAADATIASINGTAEQDSSPTKSKWKNGTWIE